MLSRAPPRHIGVQKVPRARAQNGTNLVYVYNGMKIKPVQYEIHIM